VGGIFPGLRLGAGLNAKSGGQHHHTGTAAHGFAKPISRNYILVGVILIFYTRLSSLHQAIPEFQFCEGKKTRI
jgi:hypothetical protein